MSHVRTTKSATPDQPDIVIQTPDPVIQLNGPAPVHANDNRAHANDNKVDSVSMGGRTPASEIPQERRVSFDDKVAAANAQKPVSKGGAPKIGLSEAMADLASKGFSKEAQAKFASKLASLNSGDAAYVARALRGAMSSEQLRDSATLSDAFAGHGLKLDPLAKTDNVRNFAALDRGQFRDSVRSIIADSNGVLTRGDVLTILDMVNHVSDLKDLEFARSELDKRVVAGQIKLAPGVDKLVHGFFDDRLDVKVGNTELGFAARNVRLAVSAVDNAATPSEKAQAQNQLQAAKATFKRLVTRAMDDKSSPDAAFYARRVIDRELNKGACKGGCEAQKLRAQLVSEIESKLGDRLDRKAYNASIDARVAAHEISAAEGAALKIAVATSFSHAELNYAVRDFEVVLHLHVMAELIEMEADAERRHAREQEREIEEHREEVQAEVRISEDRRRLEQAQRRNDEQRLQTVVRGVERAVQMRTIDRVDNAHTSDQLRATAGSIASAAASIAAQPVAANDPEAAGRAQYLGGVASEMASRANAAAR